MTERAGGIAQPGRCPSRDLRRYLADQPIAARPDTVRYRAAKFVRRHRRGLAVTSVILTAIVLIVTFYTLQLAAERDRARLQAEKASRVSELLTSVVTSGDPYRDPDASSGGVATPGARALLDRLATRITTELDEQPEVQAEMLTVIGRTYERLGLIDKALPLLERALDIGRRSFRLPDRRVAQTLNDLGVLQGRLGNFAAAEPLLTEGLSMRRAVVGGDDKDVAVTLSEYGRMLRDLGRLDEAERPTRDALALRLKIFGDEHRETATNKSDLGLLLMDRGDIAEAERLFRENLATTERLLGREHPNAAASKNFVGNVLAAKGDWSGDETLQREALVVRQRIFGPGSPESAFAVQSLAATLEMQGRNQEAESLLSDAYGIVTSALGADNPRVMNMAVELSRVRIARGHAADVEGMLRRALERRQRTYPAGHWRIAEAQALLGASLASQHRTEEAEALMRAADRAFTPIPGRQARSRGESRAVTKYQCCNAMTTACE